MKKIFLFLTTIALIYGCEQKKKPQVIDTELIPVVHTTKSDTNAMSRWIAPYKATLDTVMGVRIGYATMTMKAFLPESLLGNLITTAMGDYARQERQSYDCIITNIGGIRDSLRQGEITIGDIYRISPFDNNVVILTISGKKMEELCQIIASQGGQVTSGIAMTIEKGEGKNVKINRIPIDTTRNYKILTNDYLSFGNDRLYPLAEYTEISALDITLRELLIDYIQNKTKNKEQISAKLKNEINIVE